jgi:hypothetical protein
VQLHSDHGFDYHSGSRRSGGDGLETAETINDKSEAAYLQNKASDRFLRSAIIADRQRPASPFKRGGDRAAEQLALEMVVRKPAMGPAWEGLDPAGRGYGCRGLLDPFFDRATRLAAS